MDKLRRSLRSSLRRKKDHTRRHDSSGGDDGGGGGERGQNRQSERSSRGSSGGNQWQMDEVSVRSGTCSFQVKVRSPRENVQTRKGRIIFPFNISIVHVSCLTMFLPLLAENLWSHAQSLTCFPFFNQAWRDHVC